MADTYQCELCKGVFEKGWTDEEALAEAKKLFPELEGINPKDVAMLCDDCFQRIESWRKKRDSHFN